MRRLLVTAAAGLAVLALAAPAAANETARWTESNEIGNVFSCGVIEDTTATIEGIAYFGADGAWLRDLLRFSYAASYTDPSTGETISYKTRQIVGVTPDSVVLRAQGTFVRSGGAGAVLLDVGRLVVDPADGSTIFKSAKSIAFDDPTVFDQYEAAICSLF